MAVLAGVLAVLPVVRVTVVAAVEGMQARSERMAWAALTAADACGAIDGATSADDDAAVRADAEGGGTDQPAGFNDVRLRGPSAVQGRVRNHH